jgi:hypothetical protein
MFDSVAAADAFSLVNVPWAERADQVETMSGDELQKAALGLEHLRRALDAAQAQVLAKLDSRNTTMAAHGLQTGTWLARELHLPRAVTCRRVITSRRVTTEFETVGQAVANGEISWDHATTIVDAANPRVAQDIAGIQQELIDIIAMTRTFDSWSRQVHRMAEIADQDGGFRERPERVSTLKLATLSSDAIRMSATFYGYEAVVVRQMLDQEADRQFHSYTAEHESAPELLPPSRDALMATGLVELVQQATHKHHCGSHAHAHADITLVIDAQQVNPRAIDGQGITLTNAETQTILCDAAFHAVIVDSLGTPLDVGRRVRLATPAQRRALAIRDGGCVFPGCDAPAAWCDAHHVVEFSIGGATDIANLALLCRRHHGITHRDGWSMSNNDPPDDVDRHLDWSRFHWITPFGQVIQSQHQHEVLRYRVIRDHLQHFFQQREKSPSQRPRLLGPPPKAPNLQLHQDDPYRN